MVKFKGIEEDDSHTVFLSTCGENEEEVPEDIRKTVEEETDPEVLRGCLRQASKVESMNEFRQFLATRKEK